MLIGLILVAVGILALLIKLGVISGSLWGYAWPVILILLGLAMLRGRRSRGSWNCCAGWFLPGDKEDKK